MCNAFNHPKSCKCGWGSDGMMGYSNSYDNHLDIELGLLAQAYISGAKGSITQSNYQCKCCGAKVFFFQSSSGGKVLFDSLGQPWPKHDCLGITYLRKKEQLKISPNEWINVSGLSATPSGKENQSVFSGVVTNQTSAKQNRLELEVMVDDPIMIKDIYIDTKSVKAEGNTTELLILLDDGRHLFKNAEVLKVEPFEMEDLSDRRPYTDQPTLL
jgi:hypothetical protein